MRTSAGPQASPENLASSLQVTAQQIVKPWPSDSCLVEMTKHAFVLSPPQVQDPLRQGTTWPGTAKYFCLHGPGPCRPFRPFKMSSCAATPPERAGAASAAGGMTSSAPGGAAAASPPPAAPLCKSAHRAQAGLQRLHSEESCLQWRAAGLDPAFEAQCSHAPE